MKTTTKILCTAIGLLLMTQAFSQGTITIDHKTQRYINDVSTLDRTKYVHAYVQIRGNDPKFTSLKAEYNFHPDYIGGRSLGNPAAKITDGVIPAVKKKYTGVREVDPWFVTGGRPGNLFWDKTADYSQIDITDYSKQLANYTAECYKTEWDNIGRYIEPMNEPFVHAKDFYPGYSNDKNNYIIKEICEYHNYLGKAIHAIPELKNLKIMGYASAYPEFAKDNFTFWDSRFSTFMSIAGAEMDLFSVHIYDGNGDDINTSGGRRSGSNSEAILDMIEASSYKQLGVVKPLAVTEYGRTVPDQPGWTAGGSVSNYEPVTNSQAVRSQLHMVMNFMERGDLFVLGIPFNTDRGDDVTEMYAKASLWTRNEAGEIVLSMRKYFYEMLKDLKGERVRINSSNIDVQTQAFVDGNDLFVMLNNLNDNKQTVDLRLLATDGLERVDIKQLKIFTDKVPELTKSTVNSAPENISLEYGETAVLTYHFNAPIVFENKIVSKKYYSKDFLKAITANELNTFTFDAVEIGDGLATLRLGVGREHGLSLKPEVYINGTKVDIKRDVIRGMNQPNRPRFFGVMEIPFDINLLNEAGTNEVKVKFPDTGGKISSAILQVQKADKPIQTVEDVSVGSLIKAKNITIYPNPVESDLYLKGVKPVAEYQIYSYSGKQVDSGTMLNGTINVSDLSKGIYLILIDGTYVKFLKA